MAHLRAVKPKSGLPIHEEPQHSYTLPSRLYLDENIYEQEKQKIFYCNWHYAGHISQLSKSGDYLTASVADESIFIVRQCQVSEWSLIVTPSSMKEVRSSTLN